MVLDRDRDYGSRCTQSGTDGIQVIHDYQSTINRCSSAGFDFQVWIATAGIDVISRICFQLSESRATSGIDGLESVFEAAS
jgi:hypothetical protein